MIRSTVIALLSLCIAAIMSGCSDFGKTDEMKAYEAAEAKKWDDARQYADKAYENRSDLDLEGICRLSVAYALIATVNGDDDASDKFLNCYKESIEKDEQGAERFYNSLDEDMSQNLVIISGLIKLSEALGGKGVAGSWPKTEYVSADSTDVAVDDEEEL